MGLDGVELVMTLEEEVKDNAHLIYDLGVG